jgi:FAD/FMN-containing dehydrogenase/Fe-S oxidoreductase
MDLINELKSSVKGEVYFNEVYRSLYSTDASIYQVKPQGVVIPRDSDDVANTVRIAGKHKIPVSARGGGSGLAGESLCSGIIIDFGQYMNRVLEFDEQEGVITVQPGLVFESLNSYLNDTKWIFGPNPASGNRCTLGGMISNNSTGSYSLKYGFTRDYIESLEVVLCDGSLVTLGAMQSEQAGQIPVLGQLTEIIEKNREIIDRHTPTINRNTAGYLLRGVCENGRTDFCRLISGAEGTLGLVVSATLRLSERPESKAMLVLKYNDLLEAGRHVVNVLKNGPMAVEIMDKVLLDFAKESSDKFAGYIDDDTEAVLIIEFDGKSSEETCRKVDKCLKNCEQGISGHIRAVDSATCELFWNMRKAGVPLLYRHGGDRHPAHFIDDAAVPPQSLPQFISRVKEIFSKYGTYASFFAHAGDGVLHLSPFLNLKSREDIENMNGIASEFYGVVHELKGSISGEHGDGLSRTAFLPAQYGELYDLFREIKRKTDPDNILNPGKVVGDDSKLLTRNLRFGPDYRLSPPATRLRFEDFSGEVERCNGCGVCRSRQANLRMCPVFRALGEEIASTRAKSNILRDLFSGRAEPDSVRSPFFKRIMDLCLNCGSCQVDCPSLANASDLVLEGRAQFLKPDMGDRLMGRIDQLSRIGSHMPSLVNLMNSFLFSRYFMEKFFGLTAAGIMPMLSSRTLASRKRGGISGSVHKVVLFTDIYANYYNVRLGEAFVRVLRHNGTLVEVPGNQYAGMPLIVNGQIKRARGLAEVNMQMLEQWTSRGYKVVFSEPSAYLCVTREYAKLIDPERIKNLEHNLFQICDYLLAQEKKDELKKDLSGLSKKAFLHVPCHQRMFSQFRAAGELLSMVPEIGLCKEEAGCCGMGGTFGLKAKNRDVSGGIGLNLKNFILENNFDLCITECSSCRMQIEQLTGLPVYHPVEVLCNAYGLGGQFTRMSGGMSESSE